MIEPETLGVLETRALSIPCGQRILAAVQKKQTSEEVVLHGLYGFYFNERSIGYLAKEFGKHRSTV
jgi:hypothetical protein